MELEEVLLDVKVTALLVIESSADSGHGHVVLAGVGGNVEVLHQVGDVALRSHVRRVFSGASIHGFVRGGRVVLVYGGKHFAVVRADAAVLVVHQARICEDWIVGALWQDGDAAVLLLTAHNRVLKFFTARWDEGGDVVMAWKCEEKCILYCGIVVANAGENSSAAVIGGTVFQEIVIWTVVDGDKQANDAPVCHRLQGHEGVIFSLAFRGDLICSTSDDRTARLWRVKFHVPLDWSLATISPERELRGHSARVFRCLLLPNSLVVTAGEDSLLNVHDLGCGELQQQKMAHNGSPVWSLAATDDSSTVFTGGGDGAVRFWPVDKSSSTCHPEEFADDFLTEGDYPRHVCIYKSLVVCLTNDGTVFWMSAEGQRGLMLENQNLKNYALMALDDDNLCFVTLQGQFFSYRLGGEGTSLTCDLSTTQDLFTGKIFSLHVLGSSLYLVCGPDGLLKLLQAGSQPRDFVLPQTGDQYWTSCALLCTTGRFLFVGDRSGHVHLYSLEHDRDDVPQLLSNLKVHLTCSIKVHGRHGIGDMKMVNDDHLWTVGRDGTLKVLQYSEKLAALTEVNSTRLPVLCLERFLSFEDDDLVLGFHSSDFVIYSPLYQRSVMSIGCGGSHRSWDFSKPSCRNGNAKFVFIKERKVVMFSIPLLALWQSEMKAPFHHREVSVVEHFSLRARNFLVTAGEDGVVKVHEVDEEDVSLKRHCVAALNSHISSVKTVKTCALDSNSVIMVSAGGRAQMKVWLGSVSAGGIFEVSELASHLLCGSDKRRKKKWRDSDVVYDTEIRYMDLAILPPSERDPGLFRVFAGCSDGILRCFSWRKDRPYELQVICEGPSVSHCYLRTVHLDGSNRILSGTTDGFLRVWELCDETLSLISEVKAHGSGVNALFATRDLVIGGDDGGDISLTRLHPGMSSSSKHGCHAAQITGIAFLGEDMVISASGDQRVTVWKLSSDGGFSMLAQRCSAVSDVQDMTVWMGREGSVMIAVVGEGLAIFKCLLAKRVL